MTESTSLIPYPEDVNAKSEKPNVLKRRVDKILSWLRKNRENPRLVLEELSSANSNSAPAQEISQTETNMFSATREITDKKGDTYDVTYVRTNKPDARLTDDPRVQEMIPDLASLLHETFPGFEESAAVVEEKLNASNGVDIVRTKNGEAIGYHIYRFKQLDGFDTPVKAMYTTFAGVKSSYSGRSLTEISRLPVIDIEDPDIISGSTNVAAIHVANKSIATSRGLIMYPENPNPPPQIVGLAQKTLDSFYGDHTTNPQLVVDNKLVRTREPDAVRKIGYDFYDNVMKMAPNQQILYMMLKPEFNARVLNGS